LEITHSAITDNVLRLGETVVYAFNYKNNSDGVMQYVTANAKLAGEMLDFSSLQTTGYFNSLTNTITWTSISVPQLAKRGSGTERRADLHDKIKRFFPDKIA